MPTMWIKSSSSISPMHIHIDCRHTTIKTRMLLILTTRNRWIFYVNFNGRRTASHLRHIGAGCRYLFAICKKKSTYSECQHVNRNSRTLVVARELNPTQFDIYSMAHSSWNENSRVRLIRLSLAVYNVHVDGMEHHLTTFFSQWSLNIAKIKRANQCSDQMYAQIIFEHGGIEIERCYNT